jgi:hypothetical protein
VHPADVFCALAYTISVFPNDITGGREKFSGLKEKYEKCKICRHIFLITVMIKNCAKLL